MLNPTRRIPGAAPAGGRHVLPFTSWHRQITLRPKCHQKATCNLKQTALSADACSQLQDLRTPASGETVPSTEQRSNHISRRGAVFAMAAAAVAVYPSLALAAEEMTLPKEYRQLVKRLSEVLSESIEAEASGASEAEVRRKADPAKDTVREFVRKWRDNPRVSSDITHAELKEALAELGQFYLVYGQRTKLTPPVRESILRHLSAAKDSLPPEPEKGSGLLGGLFN